MADWGLVANACPGLVLTGQTSITGHVSLQGGQYITSVPRRMRKRGRFYYTGSSLPIRKWMVSSLGHHEGSTEEEV